jgi:Glycosyl hydrolases family 16
MRRTTFAAEDRPESPTELIARISAEHGSPTVTSTGRHRRPGGSVDAVVTTDPLPQRSLTRRLAPLAIGATVMLIATTVATTLRPTDDAELAAPELSNAIVQNDPATAVDLPTVPNLPIPDPVTGAPPAPQDARESSEGPTSTTQHTQKKQAPPPAPLVKPAGDGKQAGLLKGWTQVGGDEFNGSMSSKWTLYEGEGHGGNGTRSEKAVTVENGSLVIRGDSDGNTGGMAWGDSQRFGKWEMRAKFPAGDSQYHPVLILWPSDMDWPEGGEIDFAETNSASKDVSFFLHYSSSNQQKYAKKNIDITQWHNYAVEWVDGRVTGYIDGEKWFESTDGKTLPPGKMHPTIQLDYFPDGGSPKPTEMYVDYMRIYK